MKNSSKLWDLKTWSQPVALSREVVEVLGQDCLAEEVHHSRAGFGGV